MDDLKRKRLDRVNDCQDVSPTEILELVADDIARGEVVADGILVICIQRHHDGSVQHERYRARLGRNDEYVACNLAAHAVLAEWLS